MAYAYSNRDESIYALATPLAESALALVRTSGDDVVERVARCFAPAKSLTGAAGRTAVVGTFRDPDSAEAIDQVVCTVYRAPRSYTGQDAVEISCHGSIACVKSCLHALSRAGLRQAEPGEFTLRAFLAGKLGLTQAEAVREIVGARTDTARKLALGRLDGRVEQAVDRIKRELVHVLAAVNVQLDYPEEETGVVGYRTEEIESAIFELRSLVSTYAAGRLYQAGVRVTLAGATNAGKSSLFNLLLSENRSIVSETHGTTRDFIESSVDLDGIPVQLYDTAGIREIDESVEREGIRRTREVIEQAAAVVYVVDARVGVTAEDERVIEMLRSERRLIGAWNKVDLLAGDDRRTAPPRGFQSVSAETGEGLEALRTALTELLTAGSARLSGDETVIDNARQAGLVERAVGACERTLESMQAEMPADLVAVDLQDAVDALGEITGEVTSDDILDAMFSDFCVGK